MSKYEIIFRCSDGIERKEIVYAANRVMAFEVFATLGYENVKIVDCFRVREGSA